MDRTDAVLVRALCETFPAGAPIAVRTPKETAMASTAGKTGKLTNYDGESVLVERLLPAARLRLVTITADASLREAAGLLSTGTELVVEVGS